MPKMKTHRGAAKRFKKTGTGNLFMVFGEPDIEIQPVGTEGMLQVELKGLDIYDPTTGAVRSSSTDDVACWFVDTDYNGESFFVRHAYFTGADEPYEKLKRALRAEIDEAAWSTLYATVSRPFAPPSTGKIAVKVINHYWRRGAEGVWGVGAGSWGSPGGPVYCICGDNIPDPPRARADAAPPA